MYFTSDPPTIISLIQTTTLELQQMLMEELPKTVTLILRSI